MNASPLPVRIRGLYKQYESAGGVVTPVLKDVNLEVGEGEFVAIMGPSGSGKSTFMNILGCLDTSTSGDYFLNGENVRLLGRDAQANLRNRTLGFVFQGFYLLSRRSCLHNVALPLICGGAPRSVWEARASEMLSKVGLGNRLHAVPDELSGGQQQRVAIARALANRPRIILADEPTGNLDSATSHDIMQLFVQLNRDEGVTLVVVTHEPDIAAFARRLVKFRDGMIVYDGPVCDEGMQA